MCSCIILLKLNYNSYIPSTILFLKVCFFNVCVPLDTCWDWWAPVLLLICLDKVLEMKRSWLWVLQVVVPLVCITCLWCYLYEKGKNLLHNLKSWLKVTSLVIFGNEWIYTLYGIDTAHIKRRVFGDGNMLWYL